MPSLIFTPSLVNLESPLQKETVLGAWYVLGQIGERKYRSGRQSVDIGTADTVEDIKKLLHQHLLGIKPARVAEIQETVGTEDFRYIESKQPS